MLRICTVCSAANVARAGGSPNSTWGLPKITSNSVWCGINAQCRLAARERRRSLPGPSGCFFGFCVSCSITKNRPTCVVTMGGASCQLESCIFTSNSIRTASPLLAPCWISFGLAEVTAQRTLADEPFCANKSA